MKNMAAMFLLMKYAAHLAEPSMRDLEIEAFEEWQHRKNGLEDARIRVKVNTALANLR